MDLIARIRAAILTGDLAPGQRLVESELAKQFNASRPSVREALSHLAGENIVERIQNQGARVRSVSFEEAIEIAETRSALESLCAAKAAERLTPAGEARLRALADEMTEAVENGDMLRYSQANRRLHATVYEISGQRTAQRMIGLMQAQTVRQQFRLAMRPGRPYVSVKEHCAIIDAIIARDADRAARVMRDHMSSVIDAMHEAQAAAEQERAMAGFVPQTD